VPLHREGETRRAAHVNRLGRSIIGVTLDDDALAGTLDTLAMEGIGHHLMRAQYFVENTALGETHAVADGEFLVQRAVGRHAVIHPPRQFADLGVERATHGHVHFLEPAADAEEGLATLDAGPDERQGYGVAAAVVVAMCLGVLLAIFLGMDVGAPAGKQEPIAAFQKLPHAHVTRIGRDDQRQTASDLAHRGRVHRPARMGGVMVVEQMAVADNAYDRAGHTRISPLRRGLSKHQPVTQTPASSGYPSV
jgi:hypothetical protein